MTKRVDSERPNRLMERFGKVLMAADFDFDLQYKRKRENWKKAPPLFLFNKMMRHVNKMMDPNSNVGRVHAIKVVNYALMIATRLAGEKVGDKVPVEAEPKLIIDPVPLYTGSAHTPSQEFKIKPIEAEPKTPTEILEHIVETGLPPLDLGPLPNGPVEPKDASYYCPWCEHTAKLGEACRGKICCIKCGKPINSRFALLLMMARQWDYVVMKEPVTSAKMAQHLGTSTSWAGKLLKELGWEPTKWRGVIWWRWNPPKEDEKNAV